MKRMKLMSQMGGMEGMRFLTNWAFWKIFKDPGRDKGEEKEKEEYFIY